jgi:tRNA pseudouridine38-40 synthase
MTRVKLTIEYDGGPYVGWQQQENGPSVQEAIETAIHRFCGETVRLFTAGRTDAGVHALGQVAHFDMDADFPMDTVRDALNQHLRPQPIAILTAEAVDEDFHARFSARRRHYLYRIRARRAPLALDRDRVWQVFRPLDIAAMHGAAQALVGQHDFTTFRATQCQADSPVKTLDAISVFEHEGEVHVTTHAKSFLHNQVRSIVGSLKLVGDGKWTAADFKDALEAADRTRCGPLAPPHGLYLAKVDY